MGREVGVDGERVGPAVERRTAVDGRVGPVSVEWHEQSHAASASPSSQKAQGWTHICPSWNERLQAWAARRR